MDKTVLLEKRKNLLNQNKNSNEIFLSRKFINIIQLIDEETLKNFFFNSSVNHIQINKTNIINEIKEKIESIDNLNKLKEFVENELLNITNLPNECNGKELGEWKEKVCKKLIDTRLNQISELIELHNESKIDYFESNIWKLFLSFGILSGVSEYLNKDLLYLNSPIINLEIDVQVNENGIINIFKRNDANIVNNILLINLLETHFETKTSLTNFFNDVEISEEIINKYFNQIASIFPNIQLDEKNKNFSKVSKEKLSRDLGHNVFIKKIFTICLINPIGGKILQDYDQLIENDYEFPVVESVFTENKNNEVYDRDNVWELNNLLNVYQKLAVVNSLYKNTLIYGPPGTGKSEVVISLIANAIISNKNILVVSEKKAALNVIEKRLNNLSNLVMSAFDESTKDVFYERIININKKIIYSNSVELPKRDTRYNEIFDYYQILNQILNYNDITGKNIFDFLKIIKNVDNKKLSENSFIIINLINLCKLNKNFSINEIIEKIKLFISTIKKIKEAFPHIKDYRHIFNKENLKKLLENIKNNPDKKFILLSYIKNEKLINKKPLLTLKSKDEKKIDFDKLTNLINLIIDENIIYISDYEEYQKLFDNCENVNDYISYYLWTKDTKIINFINIINKKVNIDSVIHNYWSEKMNIAQKLDQILLDYYAFHLKKQMVESKEFDKKWTELVRKANLLKRPSINKLIKDHYGLLRKIFPIWVLSPLMAASILPLNKDEFDLGVFDESSQLRIEKGLPLIYRCKSSIVSGDDKQLKPTDFFQKINELDEEYVGHLDNVDSLLDKAKSSNWLSFTLMNHYRSTYEELIYFSNRYFYDNQLICITKNKNNKKSIDVIEANGIYNREKGINEIEANLTIKSLLENYEQYNSTLVVTFNLKQAEHIEVLINANATLKNLVENKKLKVCSLENVQGDEADLVIISSTFAKDKNDKFIQNFGPINQNSGMNRINVMISRAKDKIIFIKSMQSSWITNLDNANIKVLHDYIQYIEQLQTDNEILNKLLKHISAIYNEDNNLINEIKTELLNNSNLILEENQYIGTNKIDGVIKDKETNEVKLLLIFDDQEKIKKHFNDKISLITDIDRQKYYEDRNYRTIRINEIEWLINKNIIIEKIKQLSQI